MIFYPRMGTQAVSGLQRTSYKGATSAGKPGPFIAFHI